MRLTFVTAAHAVPLCKLHSQLFGQWTCTKKAADEANKNLQKANSLFLGET